MAHIKFSYWEKPSEPIFLAADVHERRGSQTCEQTDVCRQGTSLCFCETLLIHDLTVSGVLDGGGEFRVKGHVVILHFLIIYIIIK